VDLVAEQIDELLAEDQALSVLEPAEREQLRGFGSQIGRICEQLARYAVPQTLVHGDLHLGNIALQDDKYTLFDWTDACIAHPFFDLITVLNHADEMEGSLAETQTILCDAYLAGWLGYEPIEQLHKACALALPLGALHQAVSYQHILAGVEAAARAEWEGAIGYWLRKSLELLPKATDIIKRAAKV
jgi:Ser/Thr protein kinase RdoA (MazF antagonist)